VIVRGVSVHYAPGYRLSARDGTRGALACLLAAAVVCAACGKTREEAFGSKVEAGAASPDDAAAPDSGADQRPVIDAGYGGEPPPLTANVTLHVAGDSTAAIFPSTDPTGRVGWASVLQPFFGDGVRVNDAARSGRSSKSFIDEGFWTTLKAQIQPGDYVFIQFGHNDEKFEDQTRYTDPATTFRDYLRTYIGESRVRGGFPVLLTPISRRQFSGTMVASTHGNWPAAIKVVGEETGTPVIDMEDKTRTLLMSLGPVDSIPLFAQSDTTHLSAIGAPMVAALAVDGIRELGLPLGERLLP
jgi:lysophospholipase L1-like esterase